MARAPRPARRALPSWQNRALDGAQRARPPPFSRAWNLLAWRTRMRLLFIVVPLLFLAWGPAAVAQQKTVDSLTVTIDRNVLGSKDCDRMYAVTIDARILGQPATNVPSSGWTVAVASASQDCANGLPLDVTPQAEGANSGRYVARIRGRAIFEGITDKSCPT